MYNAADEGVQFRATTLFSLQRRRCSIHNGRGVQPRRCIHLNKRNNAVERGIIYSEPVQSAIDQLDLSLSITEMRLLNRSESNSQNGKSQVGKNENNIFCLKYADNISVYEAIEELSKNENILNAEPNYLYELEETYPIDAIGYVTL